MHFKLQAETYFIVRNKLKNPFKRYVEERVGYSVFSYRDLKYSKKNECGRIDQWPSKQT